MIPAQLASLLQATFPGAQLSAPQPTSGGFSNLTIRLMIDATPVIVKAAEHPDKRADIRREVQILCMLAGRGLPLPHCLAFAEDASYTANVMALLPGSNGIALYANDTASRLAAYTQLGALLAKIHAITTDQAVATDLELAARMRAIQLPVLENRLRHALRTALDHPAWAHGYGLVHGDAGLHNILWHNRLSALLDWEWAGWGNPLIDIAWIAWTMQFRRVGMAEWHALIDSYHHHAPLLDMDPATLHALALGQIAAIMSRVAHRPAALHEWVQRANWSLDLQFMR
ncbi:MAG TPA: phosphotransferase [Roseiflexaceae bacterium]|nr:phosphotransferase [Roseiflexaceae bacterium]HMP40720.1 phosphotransferase [Roseiflexaceae bacterium]